MDRLLEKQYLLTGYLEYLIDRLAPSSDLIKIITPRDPRQRGAQLSIIFSISLHDVHNQLEKKGAVVIGSFMLTTFLVTNYIDEIIRAPV